MSKDEKLLQRIFDPFDPPLCETGGPLTALSTRIGSRSRWAASTSTTATENPS